MCIESLILDLTPDALRRATRGANALDERISEVRKVDSQKLQDEYEN